MDIESDDSERWEDFFGSSTDLTPSLLGLYDTLTGSFEINTPLKLRQRSLPELNEADEDREEDDSLTIEEEDTSSKSSISTESDADRSTKSHRLERSNKHRSNIRVLSPNVQRLILHSDVDVVEKVDIDAIQHQSVNTDSPQPVHRFIKKSPPNRHQVKLSHIPLSKNTCKLTQSGNELVETFDSSSEYLDKSSSRKQPQTPIAFDNDKTPTNAGCEAFNFDIATPKKLKPVISPLSHEIEEFIGVDKVMDLAALYDSEKNNEMSDIIEAFNYLVPTSLSNNSSIADTPTTINNTTEETPKTSDAMKTSTPLVRKPSPKSSPLLTYARVKSQAANKGILNTPPRLGKANSSNDQCKTSMESLTDRLTDMKSKFSPKESRKMSLVLPEIAKLKHRPLSSSSICSTSSSSSSGSEHLNGKLATSYLASVESLADQSENELDTHNGSYSVFERACMEFVDSERSYVEDLGQVIRGYLEDWRERACLRTNELATLFSNIEDIYEFNATLLKQLINSGMDPVKIAKCFIDLRERFDVYTTYCTSYPEAISLLTSLLQATHTNALLTSTQKMLQHTLPLGSYLLKPVQRILKYHLLLDNLRKHCDVKEVVRAHEIMREVARNIDQVKRKLEQQSRVKELSGILDGWLGPELTVLGELRQEGLLMEHNKPRMVFLFGTMLIITKPKEDNRLQFKSYIHQNNLMLNEHLPGEPTSFYVIPYHEPRNQIKLTAKNRDQKRLWAQHIKGVILEKFDNIPNRAKELVYKLGDEEDRTPDTNKWKWSLNNSKPIYLERRNEYRRSEIRNRSKIKRKTSVTNSTSFEGFNDANSILNHRPLSRNHSMDDNMMPSLPKIGAIHQSPEKNAADAAECCNKAPECDCLDRKSSFISPALSKFNKERSKSVPRISVLAAEMDEDRMSLKGNLDSRKSKSTKSVEIKMYNTKTMPKRIATLKKNRSKKETSTFYMDLNEFDGTILKITESTEDLCEVEEAVEALPDDSQTEEQNPIPTESTTKEDAQIILDLLKNNKEFDKIYKKPQKKKSLDSGSNLNSPEAVVMTKQEVPPRPPSHSPPPLELEEHVQHSNVGDESNEPIYESLLRNVHVPYKFSPILNRSKSQQYYKPREKKSSPTNRPESDYVTLVYSASGNLQKIGNDLVGSGGISNGTQLHSSDSKINYETIPTPVACEVANTPNSSVGNISQSEAIYARPIPKNLIKRLLSSSKAENVSGSENSLVPRIRKSVDTVSLGFGKSNKPPERRVSDVTEMCRQSIIHRQGSEAVGERMAHIDYADPKTLFVNGSMNNSVASLNLQRDSVFSLTSSSDSVCDSSRRKMELSTNFEYEDDLEACLENDFRDSAIYSDDNEKRYDFGDSSAGDDYAHCPQSPPPLPPPRKCHGQHPSLPLKFPTGISNPAVIMGPPHMSSSASRSWVLQQIENFSK